VRFSILGPLRVWRDGIELHLGPPKQRTVLALLLAQAGRPVPARQLVDALWDQRPPHSARNVVHRHVGVLRRLLEPELESRAAARLLVRDGDGYRIDVQPDELDLLQFRALRDAAASTARDADTAARESAVDSLIKALSLWNGRCADGLPPAVRANPIIAAVDRERAEAAKEAAELALAVGRSGQLSAVLRQAADAEPYDEGLQAQLVLVLADSGHRAEALQHYRAMRARLSADLGVDPGPALREAYQRVLQQADGEGQPSGEKDPAVEGPFDGAVRTPTRPAQLPRDLDSFTGRHQELARMRALLPDGDRAARTVVISAIGGAPGVGKTTLAIHWAHEAAARFPDGQLYVDLRGYDPGGAVMPPHEAIRGFLDALEVPPAQVPSGFDAQVGLYRSLLAQRRMVVLLDNARDAEQARPLLPGSASCLSIVTSRSQLLGLVASDGAQAVRLETLTAQESLEFLARRLGAQRVSAEPGAARDIAELCGHLPLALAVVCARAAVHAHTPLATFAAELRESHGNLDAFETGDPATDARSVFSWSYRTLTPPAARMFRLLSLSPAPEVSLPAAASLADLDVRAARSALGELTRAQLWREPVPGRFTAHDLLRVYGGELALAQDPAPERAAARRRMLDHYLYTAHAVVTLVAPHRDRITLPPPAPGAQPIRFDDPKPAGSWLNTELPVLLAAAESDAGDGDGGHAWRLAAVLGTFLDRLGRWQEQIRIQERGLACAARLGDLVGQANCQRALGFAYVRAGQHEPAQLHLGRARALYAEIGDASGEALILRYFAFIANVNKQHREALAWYGQAAKLYLDAGNRSGSAATANDVGWTHILLGEYEEALRECRDAVRTAREIGDRHVEAAAWDSVGVAHQHLGRPSEALHAYAYALSHYRAVGENYLTADTLVHIGDAHWSAGASAEARTAWREALTLLEAVANPEAEDVRARLRRDPATSAR
jgi:DNA-binding SARP family transcriptional activator